MPPGNGSCAITMGGSTPHARCPVAPDWSGGVLEESTHGICLSFGHSPTQPHSSRKAAPSRDPSSLRVRSSTHLTPVATGF